MHIRLHGGYCCGIKHIHGLGHFPSHHIDARSKLSGDETSFGRHGHTGVNDGHPDDYPEDFFNEEAPDETYEARFERLVEFIKLHRSHGIIEVAVISSQFQWYPIFKRLGFEKVSEAKNSNTGNQLRVFHHSY